MTTVGFTTILLVLAVSACCAAQPVNSDQHALSRIFAEQHVENSTLDAHRQAMSLPARERYEWLMKWVLPGENHDTFRMSVAFIPTNPAPPTSQIGASAEVVINSARSQTGGDVVSPVYDLLDVAKELGRLDEVRNRVANWNVDGRQGVAFHQASMLTLIELTRNREAEASTRLDQFLALNGRQTPSETGPTSAELLVFHRSLENRSTREATGDALRRYLPWTRQDWHRSPVKRHVAAMLGRLRAFDIFSAETPATSIAVKPLQQWSAVSRVTAATRGPGCPQSRWDFQPGHVENVTSHDDDYLYFNIPLRGDFEVECDVSGFGWRDSHLMVCGNWVAPVYTHAAYDLGNFHQELKRFEVSPPLTTTKEWIHYRTVLRNQTVSTYFNGRLVRQELLSHDHDPWIAIRSSPRHEGAVRNLRITGQPIVPEEIRLSADKNFNGWVSYYDNRIGGQDGVWQQVGQTDDGGEIIGHRLSKPGNFVTSLLEAFSGPAPKTDPEVSLPAYQERLLRYHRPILEDGSIEYDFFYSPGDILTYPAIDRVAFLLAPDGVKIHWITDGTYDRSELSPANISEEPQNRRGPKRLPLLAGSWNRLQLRLNGNTASLSLNEQLIYERPLEPTNQRTFGLFHFADETQARVRNIVWKGNWPREVPPLATQELAIDETGFLDRNVEHLTSVFDHDFVKDGLPLEQFAILRGDPQAHVRHVERGVLTTRPGTGGYRNATIAPGLKVHGDFDIIATYTDFESTAAEGGNGTAMLLAILNNATADECSVARRHVHRANEVNENISQCLQVVRPVEGERRDYFGTLPMEESSGRLRLSRRGDQVYFLTAEGDSPNFQLRGQRPCATDDIQFEGLRLLTQIYQTGGAISATWSRLLVRAEALSGRAVEDSDTQLTRLNEEREKLKSVFSFDFTRQAPPDSLFRTWNHTRPWDQKDNGLLVVAPGSDNWSSVGTSVMKQITGDFDVSVNFDVLKLDTPKPGKRCSVYLQIELPDKDETQLSLIFSNLGTGATEVVSQVREPRGQGNYNYRPTGAIDLANVSKLRVARRGERITLLASTNDPKRERIVGYLDRPAIPIPASFIRFFVHTGGAGLESRVLWKTIDIRAADIPQEESVQLKANRQDLLDSVIELLRKQSVLQKEIPEDRPSTAKKPSVSR